MYQRSRGSSLARAQRQRSGDGQQRWRFTAEEWANLLGEPTANNMAVEDLLGQQAFRRLFAGSTSILRTHAASNGKDPEKSAGAVLWPEGLTVDIPTTTSNTLPLCVPLWKRQEPHDLYALMAHVNCDSNAPLMGCWHSRPCSNCAASPQQGLSFLLMVTAPSTTVTTWLMCHRSGWCPSWMPSAQQRSRRWSEHNFSGINMWVCSQCCGLGANFGGCKALMASVISKSLVERPRFMWAVLPMHHKGYGETRSRKKAAASV